MKKLLVSLLAIVMVASVLLTVILATSVSAAEAQPTATDKIYYSDLFYGYDTSYLFDSTMLKLYSKDTSVLFEDIYRDFANSTEGYWSRFKTGVNMTVSAMFKLDFREYAALMSDTYGSTDFIYTKALDSANIIFAENLLTSGKGATANAGSDLVGAGEKIAKRAKSLLSLYDTFQKNFEIEKLTDYEIFYEVFEYAKDEGIFYFIGSANITKVEELVLKDIKKYKDMVGDAADALEVVQTILVGIMLEDVRMEIVDEIIASAPEDSCIYDGMTRLKKQLSAGFLSYFAESYLKDSVLNALVDGVTKPLLKSASPTYTIIGSALNVASWVVFDVIFDVPDLGDMTTQKVLASYADDLYSLVKTKIAVFNDQFRSDDILKLEAVFDGYIAATNAALKKSEIMAQPSNSDKLIAVNAVWKDFCYSQYIESVIYTLEHTPVSERKVKFFDEWIYKSGDQFRTASDTVEKNSLYMFDGAFQANMDFNSTCTLSAEEVTPIAIKGNVSINGTTVTIPEGADVTIDGKLTVGKSIYASFVNNGTLTCLDDAEFCIGTARGSYYSSANSRLILKKNLISLYYGSADSTGTIEFAGTAQQEVSLPRAYNIEISNTSNEGVVFTSKISVSNLFDHKGNAFTLYNNGTGSTFVDYDGDGLLDHLDPHPTIPENEIEYTIIFKDENGEILSSHIYHYGDEVIAPADPTKPADNIYTYTFAGWDEEVVACAGNATYTATYTSALRNYIVVFKDWNGTVLSAKSYYWGDPVTTPADPTKTADNTYTYTFAGWDNDVVNCAGDVTYTATYTPAYINYTVVFKNWNGDVLSTKTYHWGDTVFAPSAPTRPADSEYIYTFTGWDKTVTVCAGNATYTAVFAAKSPIPDSITSSKHTIRDGVISNIGTCTTAATLIGNLNEGEYVKILQGDTVVSNDAMVGTGMIACIMDGDAVKAAVTIVATGDTNGDGKITITDMLAVKAHLLAKSALEGVHAQAADTNGDSGISITDFIQMKAHILGKSTVQPQSAAASIQLLNAAPAARSVVSTTEVTVAPATYTLTYDQPQRKKTRVAL